MNFFCRGKTTNNLSVTLSSEVSSLLKRFCSVLHQRRLAGALCDAKG